MRMKSSKTRLVSDRLLVVTKRIAEITTELNDLTAEKEKLEVTLEVLDSIGVSPIIKKSEPPESSQEVRAHAKAKPKKEKRIGVTERVITMLKNNDSGLTYYQIVDEMSKYGDVNKASLTATLSRLVKHEKLVRVDDVYLLND